MRTEALEILLVEDNPDEVELTKRALTKGKIANKLKVVRDGQEALDYMFHEVINNDKTKAPIPGLILLDIKLPKVDGIEVLRRLKSDSRLKNIPVVMLTTSRREQDIINSYDLGVNSYIVKPVDFDKFVETVKNIGFYWILTNIPPIISGEQVT